MKGVILPAGTLTLKRHTTNLTSAPKTTSSGNSGNSNSTPKRISRHIRDDNGFVCTVTSTVPRAGAPAVTVTATATQMGGKIHQRSNITKSKTVKHKRNQPLKYHQIPLKYRTATSQCFYEATFLDVAVIPSFTSLSTN